jgi:hypothetical protein
MKDSTSGNLAWPGAVLQEFIPMSNSLPPSASFIGRIFQNDAAHKGLAGAVAGILVAVVSEVLWPAA